MVEAIDAANAGGERCALATVVCVEGSAYRRPGARMLVCEGGSSTGTISAGCLEGDVVEHAQRVIAKGQAVLVEYDTASTSDELAWGLGLGCNGIVRVLVEPLAAGSLYVEALRRSCGAEVDAAPVSVATVYQHTPPESSLPAAALIETGARLVIYEDGSVSREKLSDRAAAVIESEVRALLRAGVPPGVHVFDVDGGSV
ncbi:MAG TPA: XdhC family protein, partial [Pyrinomonadaceae bacterium]|nr:XdhC family protein [Pyrinomonadaceae bacterium]